VEGIRMKNLTIGKIRGLQQIATDEGFFTMLAIDHRGSLKEMINKEHPENVTYDEIVTRKVELCRSLAKHASAVLLDPIYGAAECIRRGVLPPDTGLLVSIEATGYTGGKEKRLTTILEGWGVEKIKRMGAQAVKMLVYYRSDLKEVAGKQLATIESVAEQCLKWDIPLVLEAVSYPVGDELYNPAKFAAKKEQLVIQAADEITSLPIDVLKSEFPANISESTEAECLKICQRLNDVSRVPWVVLSQGVDYEVFAEQVKLACRSGASGFLGGRAIWKESTAFAGARERVDFLETTATRRLKALTDTAKRQAVPWFRKVGLGQDELNKTSETWYQSY
jgi:tagatose 1,6-diphosphate aldolase